MQLSEYPSVKKEKDNNVENTSNYAQISEFKVDDRFSTIK